MSRKSKTCSTIDSAYLQQFGLNRFMCVCFSPRLIAVTVCLVAALSLLGCGTGVSTEKPNVEKPPNKADKISITASDIGNEETVVSEFQIQQGSGPMTRDQRAEGESLHPLVEYTFDPDKVTFTSFEFEPSDGSPMVSIPLTEEMSKNITLLIKSKPFDSDSQLLSRSLPIGEIKGNSMSLEVHIGFISFRKNRVSFVLWTGKLADSLTNALLKEPYLEEEILKEILNALKMPVSNNVREGES
ncbi:hypothetical protein A6X21_21415 [Planctopirus hydrillae]|uniref:Uncharacterized protein n=2 Tax=Planctopirus hydrillae TaxID=1841610 RepID=A0A1C3EFP7_9PLAN|nr:hypothetical protein A6X21_21415 [Planctopirus hydrillae]